MTPQNDKTFKVPTGLQEKWDGFPWEKFPAGVTIHFGLTEAGKLYLLRRGYGYWVCEQTLRRGEVLADAVERLYQQLATEGIRLQSCLTPEVRAVRQDPATVRVLVHIECLPVASRLKFEPFRSGLVLDGIIDDHPMCREFNSLLGISSGNRPPQELRAA